MHGYIYIILKESLKNIPIIGWGAQFYNFIFLKRKWEDDKESFKRHLDSLNNPTDPMWLLIFPEGTNLAQGTKAKSAEWAEKQGLKDMKHQLLPRSKGLQFCLQNLQSTTEWLYDCTIGYEGIPPGQFGQDIFTLRSSMFEGRPPKSVNMHFRRFKIADIPVDNDKAFDIWLRNRWREKDYLLEHFAQYNSFPEDDKWLIKQQQVVKAGGKKGPMPAKNVETQIKTSSLNEFLSIFAPLGSIMTVLTLFYGGGKPEDMLKMIGDAAAQQQNVASMGDDPSSNRALKELAGSAIGSDTKLSRAMQAHATGKPTKVQQNLVQQYVAAIRPVVEKQIDLPKDALRFSNAGKGDFSLRSNQKPGPLVQKLPIPRKAATTVPDKSKSSPVAVKKAMSAAPIARATPGKPAARIPMGASTLKRPPKPRTFSSTSTVHPGDSISAVNAPTTTAQSTVVKKPLSARRTPLGTVKPIPQTNKTTPQTNVSIDPAMLMRMKSTKQGPIAPKKVQIDPKALAQMKAGATKKAG